MSPSHDKKGATAANLRSIDNTQTSTTISVAYPSPPSSPPQTKAHYREVPRQYGDTIRTSPPSHSSPFMLQKEEPTETTVNISVLRTSLGLGTLCGGLTKSGNPCKNASPAANKNEVTSQLKSMTCFTQSSTELDAALAKLVTLVHCKLHRSGIPKKSRIDAWKLTFPAGGIVIDTAATIEKCIRRLLELESNQCIEEADREQKRCPYCIGGQRVHNCVATINEIIKPKVYLNDAYLNFFLKVLETNMRCRQHINKRPLTRVSEWQLHITKIFEEQQVKTNGSTTWGEMVRTSGNPDMEASESISNKSNCDLVLRKRRFLTTDFDQDLSNYWPAAYDTSPFEIIDRNNRRNGYKGSYYTIKMTMMRELCNQDLQSGYVYVYEVEGNKGFVKIGYTTRSVEERHQEWNFDCNRASKLLYPIPSGTVARVRNARRVEALCHAELDHLRMTIYCKNCLKEHLEWFEVSSAQAIEIIQKWSTWMATDPYHQPYGLRSGKKWTLKEEERKRTWDMDRFMAKLSGAAKPAVVLGLKLDEARSEGLVASSA